MRRGLNFVCLLLSAACSSQHLDSAVEPIQGGTLDTTHTFSMGLIINSNALCTGTLIAPNLILTARHCIASTPTSIACATSTFGTNVAPSAVIASPCSDVLSPSCTTWYGVRQISTPGRNTFCGQDIALLELTSTVAGVTPATPLLTPMTDPAVMGQAFTAMGFGQTSFAESNSSGVRRILPNVNLLCVSGYGDPAYDCNTVANWPYPAEEFLGGAGLCPGDSGSSAFEQRSYDRGEVLSVGVASRAGRDAQNNCVYSVYTRTDSHAALIRAAANHAAVAGGYPPPSWAATPDSDAGASGNDAGAVQDAAADTSAEAGFLPDAAPPPDAAPGVPDAATKDAGAEDAGGLLDAAPPPRDAVASPSPSQLVTHDPVPVGGCQTAPGSRPGQATWLLLAFGFGCYRRRAHCRRMSTLLRS